VTWERELSTRHDALVAAGNPPFSVVDYGQRTSELQFGAIDATAGSSGLRRHGRVADTGKTSLQKCPARPVREIIELPAFSPLL